jgi:hypothetical protein
LLDVGKLMAVKLNELRGQLILSYWQFTKLIDRSAP